MIEKLDVIKHTDNLYDKNGFITNVACGGVVISKVNELIDAVNELQAQVAILQEHAHPTAKVDPYAEQRKWIGKACWFWDNNAQTKAFGWLEKIDQEEKEAPFLTNFGQWYDNCEPVKPDDNIIYKGGDNE